MKSTIGMFFVSGVVCTLLPLWGQQAGGKNNEAAISTSSVPPADPGGPDKVDTISGTVTGKCDECRVVLYAKGDVWYVQPMANDPYTKIEANGTWSNDTHLGTEYAALLVKADYSPPARTSTLPKVEGAVIALVVVPGRK